MITWCQEVKWNTNTTEPSWNQETVLFTDISLLVAGDNNSHLNDSHMADFLVCCVWLICCNWQRRLIRAYETIKKRQIYSLQRCILINCASVPSRHISKSSSRTAKRLNETTYRPNRNCFRNVASDRQDIAVDRMRKIRSVSVRE